VSKGDGSMSRFLCVLVLTLGSTFLLSSQSTVGPSIPTSLQEPENHAIVVDRLMRYHDSGEYDREIREVVNTARDYLEIQIKNAHNDDKLAAVFDIDETALSNWDTLSDCGFCSYPTQLKLYPNVHDPAIVPVLELYNFAKSKGIAVFFITGRQEAQRPLTTSNLKDVGYSGWTDLIMQPDGNKLPARVFKSANRQSIVNKGGYRIILNIGDQASDLAGCCSERIFKLPNPFYLVN
jgi:predicted secreted acid phosphatase